MFIIRKTVLAALGYFITQLYKQSGLYQDVFDKTHPDSDQTAYRVA